MSEQIPDLMEALRKSVEIDRCPKCGWPLSVGPHGFKNGGNGLYCTNCLQESRRAASPQERDREAIGIIRDALRLNRSYTRREFEMEYIPEDELDAALAWLDDQEAAL